jgi:hypothetical protein
MGNLGKFLSNTKRQEGTLSHSIRIQILISQMPVLRHFHSIGKSPEDDLKKGQNNTPKG